MGVSVAWWRCGVDGRMGEERRGRQGKKKEIGWR